uniref:Chromodomain helicase DNA binding protein 2 n=1 Tax=Balaenoptera musculus TaxID=9771 RepID=A0A8C0CTC9_BALMU
MMRNKDKSQEEDSSLHSNAWRVAWNALSPEAYKCTVCSNHDLFHICWSSPY